MVSPLSWNWRAAWLQHGQGDRETGSRDNERWLQGRGRGASCLLAGTHRGKSREMALPFCLSWEQHKCRNCLLAQL